MLDSYQRASSTPCWTPRKMTDHSGSNSSRQREKSSRPFYELPSHIKPCSQIIQETRMQLKYSSKVGNAEIPFGINTQSGFCEVGAGGDFTQRGNDFYGDPGFVELPNIHNDNKFGSTGIRPVDTKRPFTPRDSVSLWGVSARKRPPSAITLSRLAIDESDESLILAHGSQFPEESNHSQAAKQKAPKSSLGKVPKLQPTARGAYSFDSATEILGGLNANTSPSSSARGERDVEKARLQLKSLSLQNDRSTSFETEISGATSEDSVVSNSFGSQTNGLEYDGSSFSSHHETKNYHSQQQTDIHGTSQTKKDGHGHVSRNELTTPATKTNGDGGADGCDPYADIDSLEVAISCLQTLVMDLASTSDKTIRVEVIHVLKTIRSLITNVHTLPQLKTKLLRLIFKLVERNQTDEAILFWASFVLLHCNIVGNNLTTIFKMVFKASRSTEYWAVIKETEYLDVLMGSFAQICPKTQTESMIYGYGTLKFICMDTPVLHRCIELNLVPIMTQHLKILNTAVSKMKEIPESIFNGTFQLTSILRSVVGEDSTILDLVVRSGLLEELCNSLQWTIADIDVVSNIVRILSVISMDDMCCQVISRNDHFVEAIVRVLKLWMSKDDVMVRVTYCLGNLFAKSDEMRVKLFEKPETLQLILNLISFHVKKPTPVSMDILVKTVRIIANWILNPDIGWEICDDQQLSELLYSILLMNNVTEELVLCVISTMNNTSFYKDYNAVDDYTLRTAEYLFCNLITKDMDVKAEAMKVLGNLTRNPDVRSAAVDYVDNVLHCLDQETDEELLCATCGVLINIIVDEKVKSEFIRLNGIDSLVTILRTRNDLAVIMMASQILWNLTISNMENGHNGKYGIAEEKKSEIKEHLLSKLQSWEPDRANEAMDGGLSNNSDFYNDFETVARSLLEKL
ncbi:Armadillo repeat-containing protein 2 [Orchesella cincta]|uniref:Armadillo repeat-containing protein 2 n=1 Tax=Orchesella cincta TaxID=48709 RepID=A0A1D2N6A0_ORCCI|nr:Armadillo repeat-containing protein 2 [Orchesella cincta]